MPPALAPAAGLVNVANVVQGDEVSESLDALVDLVAVLRDNLSTPTHGASASAHAEGEWPNQQVGLTHCWLRCQRSTLYTDGLSPAPPSC